MSATDTTKVFVLLIGQGNYPNWPELNIPNVGVNLSELKLLFSNPEYCGIPIENIRIVQDEDLETTRYEIYEFFEGIQSKKATVILYYSGHGLQSVRALDDLFLATRNVRESNFEPSAIKVSELRRLFSDCIAARKILLLDCCYAGKIVEGFLSDDTSEMISKLNEFEGTYIMAASSGYERARFDPDDPNSPTKFTGKFIDVIRTGIEEDDEYCTLNSIYNHIKVSSLEMKDAPKPVQVEKNNISNFPIFKNRKFLERAPADERGWKEALKANTIAAYYKFKEQFPQSQFVKEADKIIYDIEDGDAWERASRRNTIGGYDEYLDNYSNGKYIAEAKERIQELISRGAEQDDEKSLWLQAESEKSIALLKEYLKKYPEGKFSEDALIKLNEVKREEREERVWKDAVQKNFIPLYEQYLNSFPTGKYSNEARGKIELFRRSAPPRPQPTSKSSSSFSKNFLLIFGISAAVVFILILAFSTMLSGTGKQKKTDWNSSPDTGITAHPPQAITEDPVASAPNTTESNNTNEAIYATNVTADVIHNVVQNNQNGMRIIPRFTIENASGKQGTIDAYFFYPDHSTPLSDFNQNFSTPDGFVMTRTTIKPSGNFVDYNIGNNQTALFIPYQELDLNQTRGTQHYLSFYVVVYINKQEITRSNWVDFMVGF